MDAVLQETVDRQAIMDRLCAYGWALDDRDWDGVAACFAPDAVADYGEALGCVEGPTAIAALCRGVLESLDATQHVITNHTLMIAGDDATVRCHVVAQHTRASAANGSNYTIGGTYRARVVRAAGEWLIRSLELRVRWQEGNPTVLEAPR